MLHISSPAAVDQKMIKVFFLNIAADMCVYRGLSLKTFTLNCQFYKIFDCHCICAFMCFFVVLLKWFCR